MDRALMADRLERFLTLSPVQQQIVRLYAQGLSRKEVAYQVYRSDHTIRLYLNQIYNHLGMKGKSRRHVGRELAYLMGWVDGHGARRVRMVTHREEAA